MTLNILAGVFKRKHYSRQDMRDKIEDFDSDRGFWVSLDQRRC